MISALTTFSYFIPSFLPSAILSPPILSQSHIKMIRSINLTTFPSSPSRSLSNRLLFVCDFYLDVEPQLFVAFLVFCTRQRVGGGYSSYPSAYPAAHSGGGLGGGSGLLGLGGLGTALGAATMGTALLNPVSPTHTV